MSTNATEELILECKAKTPYAVIVAPEIDVARDSILDVAKRVGRDVCFWGKFARFFMFQNNTRRFADIEELIGTSCKEAEGKPEIRTFPHETTNASHHSRSFEKLIDGISISDDEDLIVCNNDEMSMTEILLNTDSEDEIFEWFVNIVNSTLQDVILVLEGDFKLNSTTIDQAESSVSDNMVILLRNNTLTDEELTPSPWNYIGEITPVINCLPDCQFFKKIYLQTLNRFSLPIPSETTQNKVAKAAVYLTTSKMARRVFSLIIAKKGQLGISEIPMIYQSREYQNQPYSTILTPISISDENDLGGFTELKEWLISRKEILTPEAAAYGIRPPKGIILVGPPGTGKTESAKYIAKVFGRPLFAFNIEQLFSRYVGDGEKLTRKIFEYIDNLGEIVIFIDEIEKLLGDTNQKNNHETTRRLLGFLLSWQASRRSKAFVLLSSNTLSGLPPEFTRKGRFDEVFYCDLPGYEERIEILKYHLHKLQHDKTISRNKLEDLASLSKGFSGSELESCIQNALVKSYGRDKKLRYSDLEIAIKKTVPLSKSRAEDIELQRQLAKQMAIPASTKGYDSEVSSCEPHVISETISEVDKSYV